MTSIKVTNIPVQPLFLGFPGENDSRPVYVDVSPWLEEFPDATVSIVYTRSDGLTYAVVVNQIGPVVTWKPIEADLVEGKCKLQIQIKQGDAVKKDSVVDCYVGKSLDDPSDPPQDPRPTYVEEVIDAADRAEAAVTHYPQIRNDYWWVWDAESGKWVNTGVKATGESGGTAADAVLYTPQTLTPAQQAQARTNVGAGTYSKPSGGIPASDLAAGVIPSVPQMATAADMSDWTSGKTVDAATLKTDFNLALLDLDDLHTNKADKTEIPSLSGYATETWVEGKGYQTASDVQTAIAGVRQLPTGGTTGDFLRKDSNGNAAWETVQTWQGGSY